MDDFEISVDADSIHVWLDTVYGFPDKTSYFGGYDAQGSVAIHCGNYQAVGSIDFSTGEVWQFYTELLKAYNDLAGQARFCSTECNLAFTVTFGKRGHYMLEGTYQEHSLERTKLLFEIEGDQSYLNKSLSQLAQFVAKYGDKRGRHD